MREYPIISTDDFRVSIPTFADEPKKENINEE